MSLVLAIDPAGMKELTAKLDKVQARFPAAMALGLNDGGDKVRTQVQRALKQQTGVKAYSSITSRVWTTRARPGGAAASGIGPVAPGYLAYQIVARGKGIPIAEFPVRNTGRGIDAKTWGVDHLFQRSFEIKGRGVAGFRARTSDKRYPVRKLYGPSLAKELDRGIVPSVFILATGQFVLPAIVRQIERSLSK